MEEDSRVKNNRTMTHLVWMTFSEEASVEWEEWEALAEWVKVSVAWAASEVWEALMISKEEECKVFPHFSQAHFREVQALHQ